MPYCPDCFTEYIEGTTECEDCGARLWAGSPPVQSETVGEGDAADVKMVTVRTFSGPTALPDADLARNLLRTARIPCIVPGETSVELLPVLEIPLLVREEDANRAARLLKDYLDTPGPVSALEFSGD